MGRASRPKPENLGKKLKQIRENLNISQNQLIKLLDFKETELTQGIIANLETGKREPNLLLLLRYARLAGISVDVLIDDEIDLVIPSKNPKSR
jgi:transcriptional regulator with XRE-family HTH domain